MIPRRLAGSLFALSGGLVGHDITKLARTFRAETVLVVGRSDTLPEVAKALGVAEIAIGETEHDDLFAVTLLGQSAGGCGYGWSRG